MIERGRGKCRLVWEGVDSSGRSSNAGNNFIPSYPPQPHLHLILFFLFLFLLLQYSAITLFPLIQLHLLLLKFLFLHLSSYSYWNAGYNFMPSYPHSPPTSSSPPSPSHPLRKSPHLHVILPLILGGVLMPAITLCPVIHLTLLTLPLPTPPHLHIIPDLIFVFLFPLSITPLFSYFSSSISFSQYLLPDLKHSTGPKHQRSGRPDAQDKKFPFFKQSKN